MKDQFIDSWEMVFGFVKAALLYLAICVGLVFALMAAESVTKFLFGGG